MRSALASHRNPAVRTRGPRAPFRWWRLPDFRRPGPFSFSEYQRMTDKAVEIARLLAPTVESLGAELLGIEYLPAPGRARERPYIDKPEREQGGAASCKEVAGASLPGSGSSEDCEAVSREVAAQLAVEDPISGDYPLEASAPGIDRPLFALAHFRRFAGETAKVTLKLPQEGR